MTRYFHISLMIVLTALAYLFGMFVTGRLDPSTWDPYGKIILGIVWIILEGAVLWRWYSEYEEDRFYRERMARQDRRRERKGELRLVKSDRRQ